MWTKAFSEAVPLCQLCRPGLNPLSQCHFAGMLTAPWHVDRFDVINCHFAGLLTAPWHVMLTDLMFTDVINCHCAGLVTWVVDVAGMLTAR